MLGERDLVLCSRVILGERHEGESKSVPDTSSTAHLPDRDFCKHLSSVCGRDCVVPHNTLFLETDRCRHHLLMEEEKRALNNKHQTNV